jgi:hypothetical protein
MTVCVCKLHLVNDLILRTVGDIEDTHLWKSQCDSQMPNSNNESDCMLIDFCQFFVDEFVGTAARCLLK